MLKEFMNALLVVALFFLMGWMVLDCAKQEEDLVKKHCSGLTGYEYGQCQASIY